VLRLVAACCSVLWCVAIDVKGALQCVAVCCSVLQCVAVCCSVLQCIVNYITPYRRQPVFCSVLQCVAVPHELHVSVPIRCFG